MQLTPAGGRRSLHDQATPRQLQEQDLVVGPDGGTDRHQRDLAARLLRPLVVVVTQVVREVEAREAPGIG